MKNVVSKVLIMFVMSFTLLFSVSNAEFGTSPSTQWTSMSSVNVTNISYGNYTGTQVRDILKNYVSDTSNTQYSDAFNNLCSYLDSYGYDVYLYSYVYNETATLRYYYMGVVKKGVAEFGISYPITGYTNRLFCLYSLNTVPSSAYDIAVFTANSEAGLYNNFLYPNSTLSSGYMYADDTKSCLYSAGIQVNYASQSVKNISFNSGFFWDGESYFYQASFTPDTPSGNLIDSETFKSMVSDLTQSELFYQNVPSSHRKYFFVQYDVEKDRYIFYFYPSNYLIQGLLMNENDYYLISSEDFSWWENVVNFVQGLFKKENEEGFDYKMVYASVLEDGSFDYWFRNKSNEILDKTLFNFDNSPLVFSMVDIPFFGKHSGGGIDLDTGDKTLASSPESSLIGQTFEENPLELNPNPITEVAANEQSFWDKVLNRLSSITSSFLCLPGKIADAIGNKMGFNKVMFIVSPLFETIYEILGVFLACLAFIGRAITFIYTLPTIEPSSALFSVDVDTTTKGLAFTGNTWGTHFLSGLDKLKALSWGGASLWSFFEAFVVALVAVIAIKLVRKHYHM